MKCTKDSTNAATARLFSNLDSIDYFQYLPWTSFRSQAPHGCCYNTLMAIDSRLQTNSTLAKDEKSRIPIHVDPKYLWMEVHQMCTSSHSP